MKAKMRYLVELAFGVFLVVSLDLAMGILAAIFSSWIFHKELTIAMVFVGLFFSIFPDFDFIFEFMKISGHKLGPLHWPIIMFSAAGFVIIFFPLWGMIITLSLLWHFIHDIIEEGEGIAIFGPFSRARYLLKQGKIRKLSEKEEEYYFGRGEMEWIKSDYLKFAFKPVFGLTMLAGSGIAALKMIF